MRGRKDSTCRGFDPHGLQPAGASTRRGFNPQSCWGYETGFGEGEQGGLVWDNSGKFREIPGNHGKPRETKGNHGKPRETNENHGKAPETQ